MARRSPRRINPLQRGGSPVRRLTIPAVKRAAAVKPKRQRRQVVAQRLPGEDSYCDGRFGSKAGIGTGHAAAICFRVVSLTARTSRLMAYPWGAYPGQGAQPHGTERQHDGHGDERRQRRRRGDQRPRVVRNTPACKTQKRYVIS